MGNAPSVLVTLCRTVVALAGSPVFAAVGAVLLFHKISLPGIDPLSLKASDHFPSSP